jgi:hypothetical protein
VADETVTTWADFLREMKGPLVQALKFKTILLSELKRDKNVTRWKGKQITIPVINAPQQGAQMINAETTSPLGVPVILDHQQANIQSATVELSLSFSTQVMNQASSGDNGWAETVPLKMQMAEDAIGRVINEQMCGAGNALLSNVASGAGSPGLVIPVPAGTNFYQLYGGRIVSILTRSNGANPGNGRRRKIVTYDTTALTVTISTTLQASDGDSGNVTFSANEGFFIDQSFGNAIAGIGSAVATTGTFQGINKANVQAWQGVDASPAAAADPTIAVFDRAERQAYQRGGRQPDFYLSDPAVVDKFSQGIATAARWNGDTVELSTGFTGVRYRNKAIMLDYDMPAQTVYGIARDDVQIYTLDDGPNWDEHTGALFQRFSRALPVEAWLVWMLQLGFYRCNTFVKVGSLNQAT